jgi:hypothetical protein
VTAAMLALCNSELPGVDLHAALMAWIAWNDMDNSGPFVTSQRFHCRLCQQITLTCFTLVVDALFGLLRFFS